MTAEETAAGDDEPYVWDAEQVIATLFGLVATVVVASETMLGWTDVLSPLATLALLVAWMGWLLKLYAQDRIPPLLPK